MDLYVSGIKKIYGRHLKQIILFGSYARVDFREDSDIDIMILLDITKNEDFFNKWAVNYPFYANIRKEGVNLYGAA